ncbi:putative MnhA-like cation:proton antiporter [Rickettsiales endosymbiont of Paramecium tredecaurelia]|uniref:proton-conducting transporter transmembrane domain-containing protein n=1 Tax=Candidatus Sarmatiella mevalonica TaxID=2770581 RepID=UPI001923B804|nr:proton-conducting transporter membrane subunit [Candidatus Sarmatiella mevalonica]MBL3284905.1 putative MnhA-like cation:proton antiporter [Candidatus Sarmatiella mevalonica]
MLLQYSLLPIALGAALSCLKTRVARSALTILCSVIFLYLAYSLYTAANANIGPIKSHALLWRFTIWDKHYEFLLSHNNCLLFLATSILWCISTAYSAYYFSVKPANARIILFFMHIAFLCTLCILLSDNLTTMFVSYELLTISTAPMILQNNHANARAVLQYLTLLTIGATLLLTPCILLIHHATNSTIGHSIALAQHHNIALSLNQQIFLLFFIIFGLAKIPQIPLSQWINHAMCASYPVSALLHSALVVNSGIICFIKLSEFCNMDLLKAHQYHSLLFFPPLITIVYCGIKSVATHSLKNMLAYSTINHINLCLLSLLLFTYEGQVNAQHYLIKHAFLKMTLFYTIGLLYIKTNSTTLNCIKGAGYQFPIIGITINLINMALLGWLPFFYHAKIQMFIELYKYSPYLSIGWIFNYLFSIIFSYRLAFYLYSSKALKAKN